MDGLVGMRTSTLWTLTPSSASSASRARRS
jgi:hypothetical protein